MSLILELRLLLTSFLLSWAFDAMPKSGVSSVSAHPPVWVAIAKAGEALADVRVARGAKTIGEKRNAR